MKKNFAMRVAACLLVVTMLSLCMVSYTYAKYTTSDNATDSATVAKWGIVLTVIGDSDNNTEHTTLYDDSKTGDEVAGFKVTANDLAAPGTYQKLATVALTGTPEVAYKIEVQVDLDLKNWAVDGAVYCPLVFTVDSQEFKIDATNTDTAKLEAAIEDAIRLAICGDKSGTKQYNAGVAAPATAEEVLIDWTWAFEGNDDAKDTALGNAATKATIGFGLTVTVTQVD